MQLVTGTWDGKPGSSLTSACPVCLHEEKSEVPKRNSHAKILFRCSRCTYEWQALAPAEMKRQIGERKKSQNRKNRPSERSFVSVQEKVEEVDDQSILRGWRTPMRVHPNVLDRGENDSYEGSTSDSSIMIIDEKKSRKVGRSEKVKRKKNRVKKLKQLKSRNVSKTGHNHASFKDHHGMSGSKNSDIASASPSKSSRHLIPSSRHSISSQSGSYDRNEPKFADCLVKSVKCDGNMVILMGACTSCRTANEVDVAIMDAKNIMEVECYKCGTTYHMEPPSENLLKAIGTS